MAKKRLSAKAKKIMEEQRLKRSKVVSKFLMFICIASGLTAAFFAFYPRISQKTKTIIAIDNYTVRGSENLDSTEIANSIKLDENSNFFNVSTESIARKIERIQGVEKVKVTKRPFSNTIDIRITQRTPSFIVNANNKLYWADKNGALWKNQTFDSIDDFCLVVGLDLIQDEKGNRIAKDDVERFEKTHSRIRGRGVNSNNIKSIHFKDNDIVEFAASNISVPIVRLNSTLRYGTEDLVKFENILRNNGKSPVKYLDVYENAVFAK